MEINPYAAPQSEARQAISGNELTRLEHLNTEMTIKCLALLYYFAALLLILVGVGFIVGDKAKANPLLGVGILLLGIGVAGVGYGLRRLRNWARVPTILLSCIAVIYGLLELSGGVIIHILILVKMLEKQGRFVMTPEYQEIIAATPHVKRKTSIILKVLLALVVIVLLGIIGAAMLLKN